MTTRSCNRLVSAIIAPYADESIGGVGGPVLNMSGELCMGRNAISEMGTWYDEFRKQSTDGIVPCHGGLQHVIP